MPKKPRTRNNAPHQPALRRQARSVPPRWRHKPVLLGGVILVLVLGIGLFVRYRQQSQILPRLQGAIDNHYTRGVAGAPVVVKEFSDYG
jgi:hypothetical protein